MKPVILHRDEHPIGQKRISSAALKVMRRLKEAGYTTYLAGGGVRDLLLHRTPKDFDVATNATPEQIRKLFRNCRLVGRRFRLAHILFHNEVIETSTFRGAVPEPQEAAAYGRNTFCSARCGVVTRDNIFGTPEEDALRRDFTINALFYNIADFTVTDFAGGLQDLHNQVIRVIGAPCKRFAEDPVRMIRAARFAGTLGFKIEPQAHNSIRRNGELLAHTAPSRMYEEVQKLLLCNRARAVFQWLEKTSLLYSVFHDFSRWIDKDPVHQQWVFQTLEQMDRWHRAGLRVRPTLLFALLFGQYHEYLSNQRLASGHRHDAMRHAVRQHLQDLSSSVRVPKQIVCQISDIMEKQSRFERPKGRNSRQFLQSGNFSDAFLYFKFASKIHNQNRELLAYWEKMRKNRARNTMVDAPF